MRFCLISENNIDEAIGGAEIQCKYIALELVKRGHNVHYIYKSNFKRNPFNDNGIFFEPIYIPKIIQKIISRLIPLKLAVEYILLYKSMKKIRADYWYYRSVNTFLVSLVRIKNKFGGKLIYALSMDMQTRKSGWINRFGRFYHNKFEKKLNSVNYFIFQKLSQKTAFINEYSYDGIVIYNGHPYEPNFIKGKILDPSVYPLKIIWLGNLKKIKQPEKFIELVMKLHHLPIEFHMVGKKSPYFDDLITKTTREIKNFHYHGQLDNMAVLKMISTSSLTISTSSSEGFPNVFIESWKFGVPVISLINPDSLFSTYEIGFACKDIEEMIDKVKYLISNRLVYQKMSANCLKIFNKYFRIEKNVSLMLEYINDN